MMTDDTAARPEPAAIHQALFTLAAEGGVQLHHCGSGAEALRRAEDAALALYVGDLDGARHILSALPPERTANNNLLNEG